jgi:hypothetical protein
MGEKSLIFHSKRKSLNPRKNRFHEDDYFLEDNLLRKVQYLNLDYSRFDDSQIAIMWKYSKEDYTNYDYYENLREKEKEICNVFRLPPEEYLKLLIRFIDIDREFALRDERFWKKEAQKMFRMDGNKVCKLYELFDDFGWIRGKKEGLYVDIDECQEPSIFFKEYFENDDVEALESDDGFVLIRVKDTKTVLRVFKKSELVDYSLKYKFRLNV